MRYAIVTQKKGGESGYFREYPFMSLGCGGRASAGVKRNKRRTGGVLKRVR